MTQKDRRLSLVQKKIQEAAKIAAEERKKVLQQQRLFFVQMGVKAIQQKSSLEAVRSFHSYIRTLEELKGVPEGKLHPLSFDQKKDQHELLLISGVYWDLAKLYDRSSSQTRQKELEHYLEQYVLFSRGMSFQPLCAETLRKYIRHDKPLHPKFFLKAYEKIKPSHCFILTSLADVTTSEAQDVFRQLRDQFFKSFAVGRFLILQYYHYGPRLAQRVQYLSPFWRWLLGTFLNQMAIILKYFLVFLKKY